VNIIVAKQGGMMSTYSRILEQIEFPDSSEEYRTLVLSKLILARDEAIEGGISRKPENIKFKFAEAILATIEFVMKFPKGAQDLPGFVIGLWRYASTLNGISKRELLPNEVDVVSYAALIFRDSGYHNWPTQEELRQRLPRELNDEEFRQACDGLIRLEAIEYIEGERIKVVEDIDVLEQ
jgi:hypothetical protein